MSELPKGWKVSTLKDVSKIVTGNTPPRNNPSNYGGMIPWVKPSDLDKSDPIMISDEYLSEKGASVSRLIPKGAVIVSCIGNLGKLGYAGCEMATNQQINSIVFNDKMVFSRYGYHFIKTIKTWMEENASSTTIKILNKSRFEGAHFIYPSSIDEQKRIVECLELLLGKINKANERLEKIPTILKRFRQSVLSSACSGKLTADWREENDCGEWSAISIKNKFKSYNGGTPSKSEKKYWNGNIPWISSGEVKTNFVEKGKYYITKEGLDNSSSKLCEVGSVIIVVRSGILKHTLPVAIVSEQVAINQDIKCFDSGNININRWFAFWLKANQNKILEENREGTTVQSVKTETLQNIIMHLPTLPEQEEIVRRVDKLFALADKIEQRYKNAKAQLARAEKSIYAKAFRGELVKQEIE